MKTIEPIDVADFFKQQLEKQEITPPDYIWEQVSSSIPTYSTSFVSSWWIYNSIAAIILVSAVVTYLMLHQHEDTNPKANSVSQHSSKIYFKTPVAEKKELNLQQKEIKHNNQQKLNKQLPSAQLKQTIYYVESSVVGLLNKVEILDSLNQVRKVINNPISNEFGFYEMNIEQLNPGIYTLIFYRKDGTKLQRKETFR